MTLEFDKKQAKRLLKALRDGDPDAVNRLRTHHPRFNTISFSDLPHTRLTLADAQLVIARERGAPSWAIHRKRIQALLHEASVFDRAINAVIHGDTRALTTLLEDHPGLENAHSPNRRGRATLLHYIAANGVDDVHQKTPQNVVEIAEILFQAGANPNVTAEIYGGGAGSTPLVALVSSAHPAEAGVQADLVRVFLQHGALTNGILGDGRPMATALETWYPQAFKTLVAHGASLDNLVFASAAGRNDLVEQMLSADTLTPYINAFGNSLHEAQTIKQLAFVKACLCGQLQTVQLLHAHDIPINGRINHQRTGLHEAAYSGEREVVQWLVANGADTALRDTQFNSLPIHWANAAGHREIFHDLLPLSPLTLADCAEFGLTERVKTLLDADPTLVNSNNGAPLFEATAAGHLDIVRLLLDYGAQTSFTNGRGMTAHELAVRRGYDSIARLIHETETHL